MAGVRGGTVSLKKMNDNTIMETRMHDGKMLATNEITEHGNTMTVVSKDRSGNTQRQYHDVVYR